MLNHIKGENHISDKMEENNKYSGFKYTSREKETDSSHTPRRLHKQFYIDGKFNLDGLEDLTKQGWRRLYPVLPEHRTEPEETWVYSRPDAILVLYANYEKDYHNVELGADTQMFEYIKLNLEKNLECKLNEEGNSSLMDKLESN